jgi:TPR repeat protein
VINDEHASPSVIAPVKYQKAQLLCQGGQGVQIDRATALDLYNQLINDTNSGPDLIAWAKFYKALLLRQDGQGVQIDLATALDLYNQVITDKHAPPDVIAQAKYQKALLRRQGGQGVQIDLATALDLYNQVINDEHVPPDVIAKAKYDKAILLFQGGEGIQIDLATALDLYNQVIADKHVSHDLIAWAKYGKALLLRQGGEGVQIDLAIALDLYNQVIADKHASHDLIAWAKYWKAQLLCQGGQGVQIDLAIALDLYNQVINDKHAFHDLIVLAKYGKAQVLRQGGHDLATALDLYNQVINDKHAASELIAEAKLRKVETLRDSNAPPSILLKAAYTTRNTPHWQEVLDLLHARYGGENFPSLNIPEERFYSMLLLDTPETIINHLKEHGYPPERFIGDLKSFLTYVLTSDLPDFSHFQIQVLEAVRADYPSLEKFQFRFNTRESLSKICCEAAQKYAGESNHELSNWFYEQIPFDSSKYADGLEGAFMLHSNLALTENSSSIHRYKAIKHIKTKVDTYFPHLRTKQNAPQDQINIINALIRQIDEIKNKANKELKTQPPTSSLITAEISQLMKERDASTPRSTKRTGDEAKLEDQPLPKFTKK